MAEFVTSALSCYRYESLDPVFVRGKDKFVC